MDITVRGAVPDLAVVRLDLVVLAGVDDLGDLPAHDILGLGVRHPDPRALLRGGPRRAARASHAE